MSPRCVNVATQEDMLIESTEEFQVRIPNSPFVIGGGQSSVFITDDDGRFNIIGNGDPSDLVRLLL